MLLAIAAVTCAAEPPAGAAKQPADVPTAVLRPAAELRLPADRAQFAIDCNMPAHWTGDTLHLLTSGGGIPKPLPKRSSGPDLFSLGEPIDVTIDNDATYHKGRWGRWFEATWKDPAGPLYGWYHHEPEAACVEQKRSFELTVPRIGAAVSHDDGRTWKDLGIVLEAPRDSIDCATANAFFAGGHGDFSVLPDPRQEWFYFFYSNYAGPAAEQGVAVARMRVADRDAPVGKVVKWFDGGWKEPGLGGKCAPVFPVKRSWHVKDADTFWGPSIHWNTHVKRYVLILNRARDAGWKQEGHYVSFNRDLADPLGWSEPAKIHDGGEYYGQVIGIAKGETDKLAGEVARFFVHGRSSWEIVFTPAPGDARVESSPAADRLAPLAAGTVAVQGEIGRRIALTAESMLALDIENSFLRPFTARESNGGFVGLGMLIDSLVHMAAHTGDARIRDLKDRTVAAAIAAQKPDGYLGIMRPEARIWRLWDVHEMAYLIHGLTSDHLLFDRPASLAAADRIAAHLVRRLRERPGADLGDGIVSNDTATTGLDLALLRLSAASGNPAWREFAVADRRLREWNLPIIRGRWGKIGGHAYAFIDHALAQAALARAEPSAAGDRSLRSQLGRAVEFLLRENGLAITGGCGDHECWHDTQQGTVNLGETCATACVIRLMDDLLRHDGDARSGDVMERAIHNALFAAQSSDGRRLRYYTPFDGPRSYYPAVTYCCPCNFRRIVAELPGLVFYRDGADDLAVNLFTAATTKLPLGGTTVAIREETDYPRSGNITLHVDPDVPAEFTLRIRVPRWCAKGTVRVISSQPRQRVKLSSESAPISQTKHTRGKRRRSARSVSIV